MLHEEVFRGIGADHRFGHGDQPHVLALEDRSSGGGFQGIAKQPIEFMNDDNLKRSLFTDRVGEQFLEWRKNRRLSDASPTVRA